MEERMSDNERLKLMIEKMRKDYKAEFAPKKKVKRKKVKTLCKPKHLKVLFCKSVKKKVKR